MEHRLPGSPEDLPDLGWINNLIFNKFLINKNSIDYDEVHRLVVPELVGNDYVPHIIIEALIGYINPLIALICAVSLNHQLVPWESQLFESVFDRLGDILSSIGRSLLRDNQLLPESVLDYFLDFELILGFRNDFRELYISALFLQGRVFLLWMSFRVIIRHYKSE